MRKSSRSSQKARAKQLIRTSILEHTKHGKIRFNTKHKTNRQFKY